jgi:hypothetical protein
LKGRIRTNLRSTSEARGVKLVNNHKESKDMSEGKLYIEVKNL